MGILARVVAARRQHRAAVRNKGWVSWVEAMF
jgi:hypothetical protein